MKAAFATLGCKLNQFETEGIAEAFRNAGWTVTSSAKDADLIIINTCAVTSKAEQKARRLIRLFLRSNTAAQVIVTGCYAQLSKAEIETLGDRITVIPADDKASLLDWRHRRFSSGPGYDMGVLGRGALRGAAPAEGVAENRRFGARGRLPPPPDNFRFYPAQFLFHSRAFLKIQDGCDNSCAYCAVRLARGGSVSLEAADALARLREAGEAGFCEAVLTGVNIAQYRDKDGGGLGALLATLLDGTEKIALRLSSLEPDIFDDGFFDALRSPRIRPHFHLSVQSASEKILSAMGRRYSAERLLSIITRLREVKDDPFLACDIITGFPGETDVEFEETARFCREADFAWIHVFPFSPRPGTVAATLPGKISERAASARAGELGILARNGRERYIKRSVGRVVSAIRTEKASGADAEKASGAAGAVIALSENYLRVSLDLRPGGLNPASGAEFLCKITAPHDVAPHIDVIGEFV